MTQLNYLNKMKILQDQYNLIKEGKVTKFHFMKLARHHFPDLVTPTLTYDDTLRVLKNRSIISEGIGGVITKGKTPDWHKIFKEKLNEDMSLEDAKKEAYRISKEEGVTQHVNSRGKDSYVVSDWYDSDSTVYSYENGRSLNEAKEAKAIEKEPTKDVVDMETKGYDYKDKKNYDNVFGEEFLKGFYTEMGDSKNKDKTVEELKQIVAKNLAKDMNHYVKDGQFGVKGVGYTTEAPGLGTPKEAKGKHKSSGYGDLKEGKDISIKGKIVKNAKQNGDKSFTVTYKDDTTANIAVSNDAWDDLYSKYGDIKESLKESILRAKIYQLIKEEFDQSPEEIEFEKATDLIDSGESVNSVANKFPNIDKKQLQKYADEKEGIESGDLESFS